MRNVTVSVPDETYRQARVFCAQNGFSISKYFGHFLKDVAKLYRIEEAEKLLAAQPKDPESSSPPASESAGPCPSVPLDSPSEPAALASSVACSRSVPFPVTPTPL